jgi:autotransporter translocation and assembly factor TamB
VARARLLDRDVDVLTADAVVPADLTLYPFSFKPHPDEDAHARVDAPSLDLSRFAALLPPRYSMEGTLTVLAEASGAADDPAISGHIRGREIEAQLADGSRAIGRADLDLSGTALRPAVTGRIDIENGVLVIPDQSREILPAQGSALLWAEQEITGVGGMMGPPDLRRPPPSIEPNLDVRVVIPGGLWIRGEGLDVELGGELFVRTEQILLISGDLKALRGEYRLLGRVFEVEQGTVQFYGEDELNPALDLSLTTRVEGILFRVSLFGTVQEPELVLSSEPSLAEGDILSYLVLGRSVDDLDQNQVGLLKSRATDIAAVFGTTQLEGELERRLGFDMVSIREGSGREQGSALVLGKYLSPRILLKYEQELGTESNFLFNLEYLLTKAVRLETLAGEEQSGIEVTWQRDY